jgi:5-oxoprolinase (ATP-hydrolysing) subunit A
MLGGVAVVDLNADVGESFGRWTLGDDAALIPVLTSANVACGFHAGDPHTIRVTVERCAEAGVMVGAQVAYPDLSGFGRRHMDLEAADLRAAVLYQVGALDGLCRAVGQRVRYVKCHGALYHRTLVDPIQAAAVAEAVSDYRGRPALAVLTTVPSALATAAADLGLPVVDEGYADRAYDGDGVLVPRSEAGAVLHTPDAVAAQALALAGSHRSLCVHGDTPGAADLAAAVRRALLDAGHELRAFT